MRTIADYVAARRAKWRTDTESTIRFEATLYRNALLKKEKLEIARRERVSAEQVEIAILDELQLVELLIARIKAKITELLHVAKRLKASGVKLRRSKQIKVDLVVLRDEREWLTAQRDAIMERGCAKNTSFDELRVKFAAAVIKGTTAPVKPRLVAKKKAKKANAAKKRAKKRPPTLAERTRVFCSAEEIAAYLAAREAGEWTHDPQSTVDFERFVYREKYFKAEREEVWRVNEGVPRWFMIYGRMTERQKWQLRIRRANALVASLKHQWEHSRSRKRIVVNLRALYAEIKWLRHQRDKGGGRGEWDTAFLIRWEERVKAVKESKARKATVRHSKFVTEAERKAAQSAAGRRYRERKALAAGKPMPRHYKKYATNEERYQAILASNRESARRRREREHKGEKMPLLGVVEGFSFPRRPRHGPMIFEVKYASWWGREVG